MVNGIFKVLAAETRTDLPQSKLRVICETCVPHIGDGIFSDGMKTFIIACCPDIYFADKKEQLEDFYNKWESDLGAAYKACSCRNHSFATSPPLPEREPRELVNDRARERYLYIYMWRRGRERERE
eukprot:9494948-Pyramimonas_sp.AAC.1